MKVSSDQQDAHFQRAARSKQGHSCCGGCCDMRRAVIIVDIISVVFVALGLLTFTVGVQILSNLPTDPNNPTSGEEIQKTVGSIPIGLVIAMGVVKILCYVVGIQGAISFTSWMVQVALVCYVIDFFLNAWQFNIFGMVLIAFFAYPHYFLVQEMKSGIMTPDNYPNEVQSCCCV